VSSEDNILLLWQQNAKTKNILSRYVCYGFVLVENKANQKCGVYQQAF
jgi:hypothetical protein